MRRISDSLSSVSIIIMTWTNTIQTLEPPVRNLLPNHVDWELEVHKGETKSKTKVAAQLCHQVKRGVGKHLSWNRDHFSKHEAQSRVWDFSLWHKTCLNVHFGAGLFAGVVFRVPVLQVFFGRSSTDSAWANICIHIPGIGKIMVCVTQ